MWTYILGSDVNPQCLDLHTVRLLEALMPMNSSCDARSICASMRKFEAFRQVRNPLVRHGLQARVLSRERILTLKTFHRDTILLEGCYQPQRDLFLVEETTLQSACKASFRLDSRYFRANYIDLWLHVMRNHPYLSNHTSAKPIRDGNGGEPGHYLKSKAAVSKLASFAASRSFRNSDIDILLLGDHVQINSEPVRTKFPKLSCNKGNIPRNNRFSRPRSCDFEHSWKHLSLQTVFQTQNQPILKYPTAFAVVKDIVRCFWGSVTPDEINNPQRILQVQRSMEHHHDIGDESISPTCQLVTAVDSDHMQGISQGPAKMARPASSIYSRSGQSPSPQTSLRCKSTAGGASCSEEAIVESYRCREDVLSTANGAGGHEFENDVDDGSSQANESNGDALMLLSSDARSSSPASTEAETPIFPPQAMEGNVEGERLEVVKDTNRVERAHDTLHEIKKEGYRRNPHRIEKPQHYNEKKKWKQQQARLTRALQDYDEFKLTASQRQYTNLLDPERTEVDDVSSEVEPHNSQSCGVGEQSEVLPTRVEPSFSNYLSVEEASVVSNSELAIPQLVHDDSGIKGHWHDTEQDLQHGANQWYANDEDDDVQTATRKAEEQMRGADDAVGEVHDNSPAGQTQQFKADEVDGGTSSHETINVPSNTMSDAFPGGSIEPASDSSTSHHGPMQSIEAPTFSEEQAKTIEGSTSRQNKRKAIYHETGSVSEAGNNAIPRIEVTASREEKSDTAAVSENAAIPPDRPVSLFPSGDLAPGNMKPDPAKTLSSSRIPTLSKKRNLPTEPENADVYLRQPKTSNQAQLNSWEPFKETVDAVGRIRRDLDYARIYVTSSIEIEELSAQQHPNQQRLWGWP